MALRDQIKKIDQGYDKAMAQNSDLMSQNQMLINENEGASRDSLLQQARLIKKKMEAGLDITDEDMNVLRTVKAQMQGATETGSVASISEPPTAKGKPILDYDKYDKAFSKAYGQIRPIADVDLGDGTTPLTRLIDKIYSPLGKYAARKDGEIVIVDENTGEEQVLPVSDFGEAAKRFGISAGGQLAGALPGGKIAGALGKIVGSGAGTGATEVLNARNAAKAAEKFGLVNPEESQILNKAALGKAGSGFVAGAVGQGIFEGVGALGKLGKLANPLKVAGNTGREISQQKALIAEQALQDQMKVSGVDDLGSITKSLVENLKNKIDKEVNDFFTQKFDNQIKKKIATGKVNFVDFSKAYSKITKDIAQRVRSGTITEEEGGRILDFLKVNLNGVKDDIAQGSLRTTEEGKKKFFSTIEKQVESKILDKSGKPMVSTIQELNTEGFDPSKVTSLDLRRTINQIGDLYNSLSESGQGILAGLRNSIKSSMGDPASIQAGGQKLPINLPASELSILRQGFAKAKQKYTKIPQEFLELKQGSTAPSDYANTLLNLKPESARQFRTNVVGNQARAFLPALKKDILSETRGVARVTQDFVKPGSVSPQQALEASALSEKEVTDLVDQGVPIDFGKNIRGLIRDPVKEEITSSRKVVGKSLQDTLDFDPTLKNLLGKQETQKLNEQAMNLKRFQDTAGRVSTLQDSPGTVLNKVGERVVKGGINQLPGGAAISEILSATINPIQRTAGNFLGSSPIQALTQFSESELGKGIGQTGATAGTALLENPDLADIANQRIKRLLGGVSFTEGKDRR